MLARLKKQYYSVVMETSTKGNSPHPCNSARMNPAPPSFRRRPSNLILKHEILSEECDMFRATLPRRKYVNRLIRLICLVVIASLIHFLVEVGSIWISLSIITGLLSFITIFLLQTIEGNHFCLFNGPLYNFLP